jgi:hypothetical protein
LCHPDDLSNAMGGNGFWLPDSFEAAKPVPVSETAQRSFVWKAASQKPEPAVLAPRCPRSFLPLALLASSG